MKKIIGSFFFFSFLLVQLIFSNNDYQYLDDLAIQAKADKSSHYHNYTNVYAHYFAPLKDKPIKLLEIGIDKGASVKLWEEYFKTADLHFMDISLEKVEYFSQRSHYHVGNQESPQDLRKLIEKTGGNFDIIIDDGGHKMIQQIISFKYLFPQVKSGGMYIIEDLHTSYWPEYGGGNLTKTTVAFLKSLIDDVNFVGNHTRRASHINVDRSTIPDLTYYREHIYSMHFYDSMVIIFKR